MDPIVLLFVSFTLAKRNCRKYNFIPPNQRIREWDEEQQMQPCRGAVLLYPLQTLISNTRETTLSQTSLEETALHPKEKVELQSRRNLFCSSSMKQLSTTQIFQAKHLSKGKNNPHSPLESCIQCWLWHPDKPVHKTDEHTPFSKEGTKRNQDNPSREEIHAAIKALIKY